MKKRAYKKRVIVVSLLIFISVWNCGCDSDKTVDPPPPPDDLVALSIGNFWEFKILERFHTSDQWQTAIYDSVAFRIVDIIPTIVDGDTIMAAVEEWYHPRTNRPLKASWLKQNFEDGLYFLGGVSDEDTLMNKTLFLKYPASKGDTWGVPWISYDLWDNKFLYPDTLTFTCISSDTLLKTPVGNFDCVVYYFEKSQGEDILFDDLIYDYYSPGVGLVGRHYKREGSRNFPEYIEKEWLLYNYKAN